MKTSKSCLSSSNTSVSYPKGKLVSFPRPSSPAIVGTLSRTPLFGRLAHLTVRSPTSVAVVAQILPLFHNGEEPGREGAKKSSPLGIVDSGSGGTADAASSPPAVAENSDVDHPAATVWGTATSSANPEENSEGESPGSADCVAGGTTGEVPTGTASAGDDCSTTGTLQPAIDYVNDQNLDEAVRTEEKPTTATTLNEDDGQSKGVSGDDDAGSVPIETGEEQTNQEARMAEAAESTGGEGANAPPQACAESLSGSGAEESSGGRPGSAGDDSSHTPRRESRGRARSASKVSRRTSKRSIVAASRRNGGGGGGVVEPPANTPHLQVT